MKMLVVDDDFVCRQLLVSFLTESGKCDVAVDGLEALNAFKKASEEGEPYDLVCLDILMPELNGQQVLEEIRRIEAKKGIDKYHGVKVIISTVLDDFRDIKLGFAKNCEAYLVKPIHKSILLSTLRDFRLID